VLFDVGVGVGVGVFLEYTDWRRKGEKDGRMEGWKVGLYYYY
jgi:hypothetical protein